MLVLTVLSLNMFGDGVRDALDPRAKVKAGALRRRWPASSSAGWSSMVFVLFAVSVITFLIFNVIPNGDPAVRMAGKQPTEKQIEAIREDWGFNDRISRPVLDDDGEDVHRRHDQLLHPARTSSRRSGRGFRGRSRWRSARRSSGCSSGSCSACSRRCARAGLGPVADRPRADRHLDAGVLDRALMNHYLGFELSNSSASSSSRTAATCRSPRTRPSGLTT